jgi:hypothetical protein
MLLNLPFFAPQVTNNGKATYPKDKKKKKKRAR